MIYKNELARLASLLRDREEDLTAELRTLPAGTLYIRFWNGRYYYYERFPAVGNRKKERRYGISKDNEKIFGLVRKRYVNAALDIVRRDREIIEKALIRFRPSDEASLMDDFLKRYPQLDEGIYSVRNSLKDWADSYKPDETFYAQDLKSVSHNGVKMRSDGELYITARLDHYGIPHRYEAPLNIPDLGYHPDFTIIRPRDKKIIYWEHFGMVNDDNYVMGSVEKVIKYIEYGIEPWDNLIMTYNNKNGGFNAKLIDCMIEGWLL